MRDPIGIPVTDASRPGEVRRAAVALAGAVGLSDDARRRVALIATEAATNLVKHATGGEVVLRSLSAVEGGGVEILALDRGPGIADVGRALRDGYSTAGTAGNGLGALVRLADRFEIISSPAGTVLVARLHLPAAAVPPVEIGVVCLPVGTEIECGDAWAIAATPGRTAVFVADGLGHGPPAATASREAVQAFRRTAAADVTDVLHAVNTALRPTRGAAAAVAVIDTAAGRLRYAGIGNVAGTVTGPAGRLGLVSLSGTLGHETRKPRAFEYPWPAGAMLVLHSDGLSSHWDLARYPGLAVRHPALIAGVLYRDGRRERDDVTVLVVRPAGGAA